jgi:GNAT superfamily N-acetyltransferase
LHIEDLPQAYREKLPKYPIPASRLCRLAVDEAFQHQKLGSYLLMDAIQRVLHVDRVMAIHSLIVDAKHEGLRNFYSRHGFLSLDGYDLKLFLPLSTLKKLP